MESPSVKLGSNTESNASKTNREIREEYFNQLRLWLTTVKNYQCYYNKLQQEALQNNNQQVPKNSTETPRNVSNTETETSTVDPNQFSGSRCQIPSLWKRFGAELIDFFLLSIIRFMIAYFTLDSMDGMKEHFQKIIFAQVIGICMVNYIGPDYHIRLEMTPQLFAFEMKYRLVVCIYEILCLQGPLFHHGGATIGKMLLGLTVVRADELYRIRNQPSEVIALTPGGCLGWMHATCRSIIKILFPFVIPFSHLVAIAYQNRCANDLICRTIVVEHVQPFRCEESELMPINSYL